jgi:peptidylprolyl isomerase
VPRKGHKPGIIAERLYLRPTFPTISWSSRLIRLVMSFALGLCVLASASLAQAPDPQNTLVVETKVGKVLINLRPDLAPKHVERVKLLAKEGFYNGLKFHRVIDGFMAQTGDPLGTGQGGSKYPDLPAEFTREVYKRGTVGAARTPDPNSANSQFFICFGDRCRTLTGQYTIWGEVIEGMENVDKIAKGEPPAQPDVMQKVYLLANEKK